jgi:large subunit ribosomal protein L29
MTGKEVRVLKDEEIRVELRRIRKKLFDLRCQSVSQKVQDSSQFMKMRRDIARLLTEQRRRELEAAGAR